VDLARYHPNNRFAPATRALRERLSPDGDVVIGYVGRIAAEKQVERLRSLRGLPGIHLAIVGDGPHLPVVEKELRGMPVTMLGRLGGDDLAAAYASFDVFVHTGTEETFGQTVQEAHASGVPVVAPRAGGPIDLVEPGVDGYLFSPADDADLRASVAVLTADAPLRRRMGEAGRRAVLGRTWESVCGELVGHYERVILDRALAASETSATAATTPV
jgi:phosphatidylinositol alpha 1,6-mannosyltransferase